MTADKVRRARLSGVFLSIRIYTARRRCSFLVRLCRSAAVVGCSGAVALSDGDQARRQSSLDQIASVSSAKAADSLMPRIGIKTEFVVAAAEVLDESVSAQITRADWSRFRRMGRSRAFS